MASNHEAHWSAELVAKAQRVRLLCLDVDGVLTDGAMYYGPEGEALKRFSTRDASGIAQIRAIGIDVAWITAETSAITRSRAAKLKLAELVEGCTEKLKAGTDLAKRRSLSLDQCAYMGDDWFDCELLAAVGLSACPADAHFKALDAARMHSRFAGGNGAVRELCDLLLHAQSSS